MNFKYFNNVNINNHHDLIITIMSTQFETDEFGRDLSLKPKPINTNWNFLERFKTMSWAEICYLEEEEEEEKERIKQEEERIKHEEEIKKLVQERRPLREKSMYEIEHGEISE